MDIISISLEWFLSVLYIKMAKKSPEKFPKQPYEFSQLYYEKKARIQESGYSDFIEFLNWVENINKWKKKEDWKRLIDNWFNKYSDGALVWLFNMFVRFKNNRSQWYKYEDILNEARDAFNTEIYWENIIRQLFGYYWNYLKYLKRKRIDSDLTETVKAKHEKADKLKQENKQEVVKVLEVKAEESKKEGIYKESEEKSSKRKEPIQLTIQFPEDDGESEKVEEEDDPNMDELYRFDPEVEHYWDR